LSSCFHPPRKSLNKSGVLQTAVVPVEIFFYESVPFLSSNEKLSTNRRLQLQRLSFQFVVRPSQPHPIFGSLRGKQNDEKHTNGKLMDSPQLLHHNPVPAQVIFKTSAEASPTSSPPTSP